jgi:hypothetical protein
MKTISKALTTAVRIPSNYDDGFTFNVSEMLGLLLSIRELREHHISLTKISDDSLQLNISDSIYQIFLMLDEDVK